MGFVVGWRVGGASLGHSCEIRRRWTAPTQAAFGCQSSSATSRPTDIAATAACSVTHPQHRQYQNGARLSSRPPGRILQALSQPACGRRRTRRTATRAGRVLVVTRLEGLSGSVTNDAGGHRPAIGPPAWAAMPARRLRGVSWSLEPGPGTGREPLGGRLRPPVRGHRRGPAHPSRARTSALVWT